MRLPCTGMLPPSFIDYVLSRDLADGVVLTGCAEDACQNRFGIAWTEARIRGERDPYLRQRVPRERILRVWPGKAGGGALAEAIAAFRDSLPAQPSARALPKDKGNTAAKDLAPVPQPVSASGGGDV